MSACEMASSPTALRSAGTRRQAHGNEDSPRLLARACEVAAVNEKPRFAHVVEHPADRGAEERPLSTARGAGAHADQVGGWLRRVRCQDDLGGAAGAHLCA